VQVCTGNEHGGGGGGKQYCPNGQKKNGGGGQNPGVKTQDGTLYAHDGKL
jgi:hypothetical protein